MFNKINPSDVRSVTRVVCIDSLFRQDLNTTDSSNFLYKLSEPINNVVSIKLSSLELPNNWYLFAKHNYSNIFKITCYNVPNISNPNTITLEIEHLIEIPEGNYLADTFEIALSNYFLNIGDGLQYIGIAVNPVSAKTEFYSGVSSDKYPFDPYTNMDISIDNRFYFKIDFTIANTKTFPLFKTIGWTLGFRQYIYIVKYRENISKRVTDSQNQTYLSYLESESSFGSSFTQYILFEVDDFQKNVQSNTIVSFNGEYNLSNNIFAKIPITSGQYTCITDNGSDLMFKKRNYFGPIRLEKMHLRLITRFGDILNLNGNNFSFTLEVEVLYS